MKISFYGTDSHTYNRTMVGLDYNKTISRVHDLFRIRREGKKKNPRVIIQYLPQALNNEQINEFRLLFSNVIDKNIGDSLKVISLHNYGDGRNYRCIGNKSHSICGFPWRTMVILFDGTVVPCCFDFNGVMPVGDVRKNTVEEIWNGPVYNQMRDDFKKLRYEGYTLCSRCARVR
jgi:radical SAM protein with 4Fe4S-binding SPASM domain